MPNHEFEITYKISNIGTLETQEAQQLSLLDITNYSFEGDLVIVTEKAKMTLAEIPLLEAFHAIRQILKIMPIFTKAVPYAQMFREARTFFSTEMDTIRIEHQEIQKLKTHSGASHIDGSYTQFCCEFGDATKKFIGELQVITPSLFRDDKTVARFTDLFVATKIKKNDQDVYSIV